MSICIPGNCPHERDVFIWVADGPWFGDASDPDSGRYPWVHATSSSPGHLEVCDLKPFATAEEAGEVCACGHESRRHAPGPVPVGRPAASLPCLDCGCADFRHRPEDLARERGREDWRRAGAIVTGAPAPAESQPAEDAQLELFPSGGSDPGPPRRRRGPRRYISETVPVAGGLL
jgi:hypothetical protein